MRRQTDEFGDVLRWTLVGIAALTLVIVYLGAWQVFGFTVWSPWATNRQTEITRNTNQYVETQQAKIFGLVRQYDQLGNYAPSEQITRQQADLVAQMCEAAGKIDPEFVPEHAMPLMRQEGCWS